jgi:hypothetical protein
MSLIKKKENIKKALKSGSKEDIDQALSSYWFEKNRLNGDKDIELLTKEIFGED